jgi:hypothetical protein
MKKTCSLSLLLLTLPGIPPAAHAAELGRLFYTPQQRQQLEYQEATSGTAEGGPRNYIIVDGVVQKQGGKRTIWINGVPQSDERSNDKAPASVSVTVPGKKRPVPAKVGEKILLEPPAQEEAN